MQHAAAVLGCRALLGCASGIVDYAHPLDADWFRRLFRYRASRVVDYALPIDADWFLRFCFVVASLTLSIRSRCSRLRVFIVAKAASRCVGLRFLRRFVVIVASIAQRLLVLRMFV